MSAFLKGAGWYAKHGFAVFPVYEITEAGDCACPPDSDTRTHGRCRHPGKHPRVRGGCHAGSMDARQLRRWAAMAPSANVGITTGRPLPDGRYLLVLDQDPRNGGDDRLRDLERKHGPLPETPRVLTGGGGAHYYLRSATPLRGRKLVLDGKPVEGIDLKGEGGFVVAPPSRHESGRCYAWDASAHIADLPLADAPEWLVAAVVEQTAARAARPADEWAALIRDGVDKGERNGTVARLAGHLLRRLDPFVVLELIRAWNVARCRPPLPDDEVTATVDSICAREARRRAGG